MNECEREAAAKWRTDDKILNFCIFREYVERMKETKPDELKRLYEDGTLKDYVASKVIGFITHSRVLSALAQETTEYEAYQQMEITISSDFGSASDTDKLCPAFAEEIDAWLVRQRRDYEAHRRYY